MSLVQKCYIGNSGDGLIALDLERRTYAAINRAGTRYHLLQPLEANHPLVVDGKRQAGQLGCTCAGGVFNGSCYQIMEAEAYEATLFARGATWFDAPGDYDAPVSAGESVESFRG